MTVHRCDFPFVQAWAQHVQKLVQGSGSIRKQCVFDSALHFRSINSDARWLRGSGLLLRGVRVTLAELQGSVPRKDYHFARQPWKPADHSDLWKLGTAIACQSHLFWSRHVETRKVRTSFVLYQFLFLLVWVFWVLGSEMPWHATTSAAELPEVPLPSIGVQCIS